MVDIMAKKYLHYTPTVLLVGLLAMHLIIIVLSLTEIRLFNDASISMMKLFSVLS